MVRPLRIEYANAWYHISSRGSERGSIFRDDKDRKRFLRTLAESIEAFRVEVHCYVLMSNHFHFLLRTLEANLSRFMQRFNTAYTTYFNLRHHRKGHLYKGRFKAILVEADEYLLGLSHYIHLNPVRLKKYKDISVEEKARILKRYRWSSLLGYVSTRKRDGFINYEEVLGHMGGDNKNGRARYLNFVLAGLRGELKNPLKETKANAILGSESFVSWVKGKFLGERELMSRDYANLKLINKAIPIKEIAKEVAKEYGIRAEDIIKSRSRFREARQVLMEISHRMNLSRKSLREIGRELGGVSGEAITKIHNQMQVRLKKDRKLAKRIDGVVRRLQS